MPNWEIETDYDFTDSLLPEGWAWEFLRRNPEYLRHWDFGCAEVFRKETLYKGYEKSPQLIYAVVPKSAEYPVLWKEYKKKHPPKQNDQKEYAIICDELANVWGIRVLVDPDYDKPNLLEFPNEFSFLKLTTKQRRNGMDAFLFSGNDVRASNICNSYLFTDGGDKASVLIKPTAFKEEVKIDLSENQLLMSVDLRKPLKPQFESHFVSAKKFQAYHRKNGSSAVVTDSIKMTPKRCKDWKLYLRCLDAKKAGIRRSYATSKLFNVASQDNLNRKWDETIKQANRMSKVGYLSLVTWRQPKGGVFNYAHNPR